MATHTGSALIAKPVILEGGRRQSSLLKVQRSLFQSVEFDPQKQTRVLVLYTGGTIGMAWNNGSYCPEPNYLVDAIRRYDSNIWECIPVVYPFCRRYPHLHDRSYATIFAPDEELRPLVLPEFHEHKKLLYYVKEYNPLLDSSNMTTDDWCLIAKDVYENYEDFDGFVRSQKWQLSAGLRYCTEPSIDTY